ncbi:MAG: SAM-dependent methyltransferase [Alphaproteobacteria bacterium]
MRDDIKAKPRGAGNSRFEPADSTDFFPTPPWGTRALIEHVMKPLFLFNRNHKVWEPACGTLDMVRPLQEYYAGVRATDIDARGDTSGNIKDEFDFANGVTCNANKNNCCDWVITNLPFNLFMDFFISSLGAARHGLALLAPLTVIEGSGRYEEIFKPYAGKFCVAPFVERLPIVKNTVRRDATTARAYAWLVVAKQSGGIPPLLHIPPCRKQLERDEDYS